MVQGGCSLAEQNQRGTNWSNSGKFLQKKTNGKICLEIGSIQPMWHMWMCGLFERVVPGNRAWPRNFVAAIDSTNGAWYDCSIWFGVFQCSSNQTCRAQSCRIHTGHSPECPIQPSGQNIKFGGVSANDFLNAQFWQIVRGVRQCVLVVLCRFVLQKACKHCTLHLLAAWQLRGLQIVALVSFDSCSGFSSFLRMSQTWPQCARHARRHGQSLKDASRRVKTSVKYLMKS